MNRSTPRRLLGAAACALAGLLAACESNGGGGAPGRTGSDAEGTVLAEGVRIASIDRSAMAGEGRVTYRVDNVSGRDLDDLVWSVTFVFPRRSGMGDIQVEEETETTAERPLGLQRGEQGRAVVAVCGAFAERRAMGQQAIGTRLNVASNPPVLTVARAADGTPGTRFAANRIECVGQSDIWADAESLTIEFENVSGQKVTDLEVQAVFVDTKARTKWKAIPSMAPGQRAKATLDLRGLDLGGRDFLVNVRMQDV
jgi:hypothetical protein